MAKAHAALEVFLHEGFHKFQHAVCIDISGTLSSLRSDDNRFGISLSGTAHLTDHIFLL